MAFGRKRCKGPLPACSRTDRVGWTSQAHQYPDASVVHVETRERGNLWNTLERQTKHCTGAWMTELKLFLYEYVSEGLLVSGNGWTWTFGLIDYFLEQFLVYGKTVKKVQSFWIPVLQPKVPLLFTSRISVVRCCNDEPVLTSCVSADACSCLSVPSWWCAFHAFRQTQQDVYPLL